MQTKKQARQLSFFYGKVRIVEFNFKRLIDNDVIFTNLDIKSGTLVILTLTSHKRESLWLIYDRKDYNINKSN